MPRLLLPTLLVTAALAGGCRHPEPAQASARPPVVVDSAIARDEALRRFRAGLPRIDSLLGGAESREALVRRFVKALENSDTAAFRDLVLTRQEFAWLYYPTNAQGLPPYELAPDLFWFMLETRSRRGIVHALAERSGQPLGYLRTDCDSVPSIEGDNRVWGPCTITRRDSLVERLFGPIIERHGRFKFVSYANNLD